MDTDIQPGSDTARVRLVNRCKQGHCRKLGAHLALSNKAE